MIYRNGEAIAATLGNANVDPSAGEIYSTEEQVIGRWIDGKPLYRKVVAGIIPTNISSGHSIDPDITKCYHFVNGTVEYPNSRNIDVLPVTTLSGITILKVLFNEMLGLAIYGAGDNATHAGGIYNIAVEYTKTTDEPTIQLENSQYLQSIADMTANYAVPTTYGGVVYNEEFNNE